MAEGSTVNATWKAVRTLEWKQKQKKPAAASKGVGAILGEAADVVVGKYAANGPGALGASSAYLNRLSEIQIQDEAYIHQQLVKPDEVKPKRPAHRLLLPRGSKSGRGLRISLSRKVRFNDGDSSPTHKAAAAAGRTAQPGSTGTAASATKPDAAAGIAGHGLSRTSSSEGGGVQVAAVGHKAGRRPGVSFAAPGGTSSPGGGSSSQVMSDGPSAARVGSGTPQAVDNAIASTTSTAASASSGAEGHRYNNHESLTGPGKQKLPAADQQGQQQQQAQHMKPGSINGGSSSNSSQRQPVRAQPAGAGGGQHTHAGPPASTTSSSSAHMLGDNAIMTRFLQQQPCGLESPHGSGTDSSGMMGMSQQPDRHAGGSTAAATPSGRRTTDLVDKQLQWLRGGSAGSTNNSSSGGAGGSSAPSTQQIARVGSGVPPEDFSITLGYRPMAIPQELFDRWSNVGAAKPATQAGPTATAAVGSGSRPTGAGAASATSSSSKDIGAAASRRNSSETVVPGSRLGASPSPTGSRPGSGPETHHAASKTLAGQPPNPSGGTASLASAAGGTAASGTGGGGGMSWQCDAGGAPPARRLSAANVLDNLEHHRPPQRQRTADGITLSNLAASLKPPSSSSTSRMAGSGATGSTAAGLTSNTAASLPASGRASPVLEPGRGGSSNTRHAGTAGAAVSSTRIAAAVTAGVPRASSVPAGSSSWQQQQSNEKCSSSSHGSNSSGNSDPQTGRLSPFRPASHPGTLGKTGSPAAAAAAEKGSSHMGPRRASSRALQDDLALAAGGTGSVTAGQHRTAAPASSSQQHWSGQLQPPQQHP